MRVLVARADRQIDLRRNAKAITGFMTLPAAQHAHIREIATATAIVRLNLNEEGPLSIN